MNILLNPELAHLYTEEVKNRSLDQKILFLVSLETRQKRYRAQVACRIDFADQEKGMLKFSVKGFADAVKEDTVYELKFVAELTHEHFLQCACYMIALKLPKGILWNTRDNTSYEIEVPDRKTFLDAVAKTISKGAMERYYEPGFTGEKNAEKKRLVQRNA